MAVKKLESQYLTFYLEDETLDEIECNIEVKDDSQWKAINITTKNEKIAKIQNQEFVDVKISTKNFNGGEYKTTEINKAMIRGFGFNFGNSVTIFHFTLYPSEVYIKQRYAIASKKRRVTLNYYINKAPMIAPRHRLKPNENGEVKLVRGHSITINTDEKLKIKSEIGFNTQLKGDVFKSDRYQILTTSFSRTKDVIKFINEKVTPQINNILMLSSLLHDNKVGFTSWRAETNGMMIWYYKSLTIKPDDIDESRFKDLVERVDVSDFIQKSLPGYSHSEYKASIDNSIYTLMLKNNNVIELAFLSYFQALESMILTFKKINGSEFIFEISEFKALRSALEKTIENEIPDNKLLRKKVKEKLAELRRVSLKDAANDFFENFKINTDNIWPLFDDKGNSVTGLTSIRNVLIHGDLLPPQKIRSVAVACEHLRVLLLRCVFSLLGWDVEKTKLRSDYLTESHHLFDKQIVNDSIEDIHFHFLQKNRG